MIEVSWDKFKQKFQGREQTVFEEICYHVFCDLTENSQGIFRFQNHPGIETIAVLYQEKYTGFQAKFFLDDLPEHKSDFLDTIKKTRNHNTRVQKIYYFLPIDPGPNQRGVDDSLKPQWLKDVEVEAIRNNLEIEWWGLSRFQSFFAKEEHQFLTRHYFDTKPDLWDCISFLQERTKSRLNVINTEISFQNKQIHIDHNDIVQQLCSLNTKQIAVVSGIGGTGKTAVIKEWFASLSKDSLAILLQPNEVIQYLSELNLLKTWSSSLNDFFLSTKEFTNNILVIDAAEKITEESQLSDLIIICKAFIESNWQLVFTTRPIYSNQLIIHLKTLFANTETIDIPVPRIPEEHLIDISQKYHFALPNNSKIIDAIRLPFNLYAYLSCTNSSNAATLDDFEQMVWNHLVLGDTPNDTAGTTFCKLVEQKLRTNASYLKADENLDNVRYLCERGILVNQEGTTKYFISHDIYEEWAIIKLFNGQRKTLSQKDFECDVLSSYALRRAFRVWLEVQLQKLERSTNDDILVFLESSNDIIVIEFLIALVTSNNLERVLNLFSSSFLDNRKHFLDKMVACMYNIGRTKDTNPLLLGKQEPLENTWKVLINFVNDHFQQLNILKVQSLLSLMLDWSLVHPENETTKLCSCMCWKTVDLIENNTISYHDRSNSLLKVIAASSQSDKNTFVVNMEKHLAAYKGKHYGILDDLCEEILQTLDTAYKVVITYFPDLVIQIASKYWRHKHTRDILGAYDYDKVEHDCGLSTRFHYLPVSFLQTPIYQLLYVNPIITIDFIVDFTNECVNNFNHNNPDQLDTISLSFPNGKTKTQFITPGLWNMYRGKCIGDHWPYLLQAMHMALEHYCLEQIINAKTEDKEFVINFTKSIMFKILLDSASSSLTAVVVSIICAYPNDFTDIALILLSNRTILSFDFIRAFHETQPDFGKILFPLPQTEHDIIREKYDNHPCRDKSLEQVALQYQLFPPSNNLEIKKKVENIIDSWASNYDNLPQEEQFRILRMDARRQLFKYYKNEKHQTVIISPSLTKEQEEAHNESSRDSEYQTIALKLNKWASKIVYGTTQKDQIYTSLDEVLSDYDKILSLQDPKDYNQSFFFIPAIQCTVAALIIGYYDNISQQRKEQCYNLVKDFLTEAINKFNPSSRLDHIGDILLATPFLCSHLKIFRRTKIEKLFVYCLLNEDTNPMMNVDSLSSYGNAGIRNYLAKTNDVQLFKRLRKRYIKHFIHYHVHLKANYAFRRPFPFTYRMASKIYKVCQWLHIPSPSCFNPNKYYSQEDITLHNPITQYSKCFWAKHKPLFHIEKDINSHLHCNLVQFLNPAQISVQEENSIINCLKICLEYLFPIREKEKSSTPSYIYWLREKYLRQLSLCVLNMSRDGRRKFIGELSSIDKVNFVAEFVKQLVIAEDMFTHQKAFWEIMINILADAEKEIDNHCPQSREYTELLEALTLTSIKWKEDVNSWNSFGKDTIEYFKQLISTFGQHKYLAICICHFINGIGQCYLFEGITWISTILANSSISFEDETSELFNVTFENLIPKINEKKDEIKNNPTIRVDLITILDYLIVHNSLPAFTLREEIT